jgi:hypothetical protein
MTRTKKAKRMRSILLKGFGFTELAEAEANAMHWLSEFGFGFTEIAVAEDNACIGYPNLAMGLPRREWNAAN